MRNFIIIILVCFISNTFTFAQAPDGNWRLYPSEDTTSGNIDSSLSTTSITPIKIDTVRTIKVADVLGKMNIKKDERLDKISKELGTPSDGVSVKIHGYRLQLVVASKKVLIDKERSKFIALHNDIPTYMDYHVPNFRLRVGDYRTKLEAQKLQNELKSIFPSAIVVNDMIELPKIQQKKNP